MTAVQSVIILLINGLQIALPAPAFVEDGRAWVPARAALSACGFTVDWEHTTSSLVCEKRGHRIEIVPGSNEVLLNNVAFGLEDAPRLLNGVLFVSSEVMKLAVVDSGLSWNGATKILSIDSHFSRVGDAVNASVEDLTNGPFEYVGRSVYVTGEYWDNGLLPRVGPSRGWMLRGPEETIGCRIRSGSGITTELPQLRNGKRCRVKAICNMSKDGSLYLDIVELQSVPSHSGMVCYVGTDRLEYRRFEAIVVEIEMANNGDDAFECGPIRAEIIDSHGHLVWTQKLDVPSRIKAGWEYSERFVWANAGAAGRFKLQLACEEAQWAHAQHFTIRG